MSDNHNDNHHSTEEDVPRIVKDAATFLSSRRGAYIMGQALAIAVQQLESVQPEHMQEKSNISDMKLLARLFPIGWAAHSPEAEEARRRLLNNTDEGGTATGSTA